MIVYNGFNDAALNAINRIARQKKAAVFSSNFIDVLD